MQLDEKIGQLFVAGARGLFMSESSSAYRQMLHHVRDHHIGGFIWFLSNVYETALLIRRLNQESKIPLLCSADLEAGVGMRFLDTTFWPSAMAIAATGDVSYAEQAGRVVAREAKAIGINHVLAPVADVNVNAGNPVINTRSFGEDPQEVARYVAAMVRGIQSEGVLACAKHFPGHGDTRVDSHRALPVLHVTRERLDAVELVPFRAAIDAGVKSVMMGHLAVPALDDEPAPVRGVVVNPYGTRADEVTQNGTMPATVSPKMIALLREELQFGGLVVTDSFDMGGLAEHFDTGEACVRAIEAGEDQILMPMDIDAAIAAVKDAVACGRIRESRIDESVQRILAAKSFARTAVPDPEEIFRTIDSPQHRALAEEIGQRAVTLVKGTLPIRGTVTLMVVSDTADVTLADFERELRKRTRVETSLDAPSDHFVLALALRARSGAGSIAVPQRIRDLALPPGTVAVSFGSPYVIRELPNVRTYLCAYGIQPVMQVAVARALFGEAPVTGRLPVTSP